MLLDLYNLFYIESTLLLFSSFVPSHLHCWKVENFMKVAKVGEDKSFNFFNICNDYGQCFWYLIIVFHDSFVLHIVGIYIGFYWKAHLWSNKGRGSYFSLFTFDKYYVYSSIPLVFTESWNFITHFFNFYSQAWGCVGVERSWIFF